MSDVKKSFCTVSNYSDAQSKVREATSNDPWGPAACLMSDISDMTYNHLAFSDIMQMLWNRMKDSGKDWRHVYKALVVMEYIIKAGTEKVAQHCMENLHCIQTLTNFQHMEESNDLGMYIQEKAKQVVLLLTDEGRLKNERLENERIKAAMSPVDVSLAGAVIYRPWLLAQHVFKLYTSGTASDCTLVSRDGKEFAAHRAILAAWSPVLGSMFATDMTEKACGVCRMENFDGKVIAALLSFIYTCSLSGIGEFVEEMLDLADQYDIPDLAAACEEFVVEDVQLNTAPEYFHLAHQRGLHALKSKVAHFIAQHEHEY